MIYKNKFGKIKLPKKLNNKVIGLSMSGGADSTILCYLLAKFCQDKIFNYVIQPFSAYDLSVPGDAKKLPDIIQYIRNKFPDVQIRWPISTVFPNPNFIPVKNEYLGSLKKILTHYKVYDIFVSAISLGPPLEVQKTFETNDSKNIKRLEGYDLYNELLVGKNNKRTLKPFVNINKSFIIQCYKDFKEEKLLEITESCIQLVKCKPGDKFCWWCLEKDWAIKKVYTD